MGKRLALTIWLTLAAAAAGQTIQPVAVTGHLGDVTGSPNPGTYVQAQLQGCGANQPRVFGYFGIVQQTAQFVPDVTGVIAGQLWANNQIDCGGTSGGTRYRVTYVSNNVPQGPGLCYFIPSNVGTFNFDTAVPQSCSGGGSPVTQDGSFGNLMVSGVILARGANILNAGVFNSTTFNSDEYPGTDVCARIQSTQAAMGSQQGTIEVNTAGTCATALTLTRPLVVKAPVGFAASITNPASPITCSDYSATLTNTSAAPIVLPDGSTGARVTGCHFVGSNTNQFAIHGTGSASRFQINRNFFEGITPLQVEGGAAPNADDRFEDNDVVCTANPQGCGYAITMYGINVRPILSRIKVTGALGGAQIYSISGNTPYPSLATILAAGSTGGVITQFTCKNISQQNAGACVFLDGVYGYEVADSTCDGDGDVCFDAEISAYNNFHGNWATGCGNGCYSIFFASYGNQFKGNHGFSNNGSAVFVLKNNSNTNGGNRGDLQSVDTLLQGNTMTCAGVYPGVFMETMHSTHLYGNHFVNCGLGYNERNTDLQIVGNDFKYSISTAGAPGLYANQTVFGATTTVSQNTIYSEVAQTGSCMAAANSDFGNTNQFLFLENKCHGWAAQLTLTDTTTSMNQKVLERGNLLDSISPTYTAPSGNWTVTHSLNYSYTATE